MIEPLRSGSSAPFIAAAARRYERTPRLLNRAWPISRCARRWTSPTNLSNLGKLRRRWVLDSHAVSLPAAPPLQPGLPGQRRSGVGVAPHATGEGLQRLRREGFRSRHPSGVNAVDYRPIDFTGQRPLLGREMGPERGGSAGVDQVCCADGRHGSVAVNVSVAARCCCSMHCASGQQQASAPAARGCRPERPGFVMGRCSSGPPPGRRLCPREVVLDQRSQRKGDQRRAAAQHCGCAADT